MDSENHKIDKRTFSSGASHDISPEIVGTENKGVYYDSENGRISSDRGNKGDWEKIRGEELVWRQDATGTWYCLCAESVNNDIFEIWVTKNNSQNPYIAINGVKMGQSSDMPWLYSKPLQWDVNESCVGGEIFLTDHNASPSIFNIKDIKDNFANGTQKYFSDFDYDLYSTNLKTPLDIPVFTGLVDLGGGGGLPVGSYQYSFRYVTADGDRTNFGPNTPAIPVVSRSKAPTYIYPLSLTNTTAPDNSSSTPYGVNIRFRVTNDSNYDFIEIKRISYNSGEGPDSVPVAEIVGRIAIQPGEVSVKDFVDPRDSSDSIPLTDEEEAGNVFLIAKAKAVRYYGKRNVLMNVGTTSKESAATFKSYNGKKIFPIVDKLGVAGFIEPLNHAYKKNYMSNDKYTFAAALFDGVGGRGFAIEDNALKNVQVPSRRDPVTGDSLNFSFGGVVTASNKDFLVGPTFESFDNVNGVAKSDPTNYRNISAKGNKNGVNGEDIGYLPYRPASPGDLTDGAWFNPTVLAKLSSSQYNSYSPNGFRPNYYTKGFAIGGLSNLPSWAKSFAILRSNRAKRVVCQGIGMYALNQADFGLIGNASLATKEKNKFWFHSPDIASGLVPSSIIEDMEANPSNYKIQFVSPLGFFSEVYNFDYTIADRDKLIDMIAYARVLYDNGSINTGESSSMGQNGYVAYNRYRNTSDSVGGGFFNHPDKGNRLSTLLGFSYKQEGRDGYYELRTSDNIYNINNVGGVSNRDFVDQGMKDFTEPIYLINIIQEGADVQDLDVNSYYSTGHYQKIESLIGIGNNTLNQTFQLVDERWEDCIPSLTPSGFNAADERYIYTENQSLKKTYLNTTYYTTLNKQTIVNAIAANGSYTTPLGKVIHGIYSHYQQNGIIYIVFDYAGTVPDVNDRILVKYDDRVPIRFFGGDTVVAENIFSPIDKEADSSDNPKDTQFAMGIGFPYFGFEMNPKHFVHKEAGGIFADQIQDQDRFELGYIRQLAMMYNCESETASNFQINASYPTQYFPATHYVMRPNKIEDGSFSSGDLDDISNDNDIFREYFDDYPNEYLYWKFGGIRFLPGRNINYVSYGPKNYFSKPKFGFTEETNFCTGIAYSLPRATNQQNSPGLRTFLASNFFIADDDSGEIKKAWDSRVGGSGENLYAICEKGVVLLLTKKSILSNINGDDLAITSSDSFISDQYWISKEIGSNSQMWRAMAEGSFEMNSGGGKTEVEGLFIPNRHSVYLLSQNGITDVLKDSYRSRISSSLSSIPEDFSKEITGHYDKNHNEYWIQIEDQKSGLLDMRKTFAYDISEGRWIGRFDYVYDKYLYFKNKNYGFRLNRMNELDKGFIINGNQISARLTGFASPELGREKEWISIEIYTGLRGTMKPFAVFFKDETLITKCVLSEIQFGSSYLKQHDGWYGQVPRQTIDKRRLQNRLLMFEILHNLAEDFKVSAVSIKYKTLI